MKTSFALAICAAISTYAQESQFRIQVPDSSFAPSGNTLVTAEEQVKYEGVKLVQLCDSVVVPASDSPAWEMIREMDLDVVSGDGQGCWNVLMAEQHAQALAPFFENNSGDIRASVVDASLTSMIANERKRISDYRSKNPTWADIKKTWFEEYHTYDEIKQWYQELSGDYPQLTRFVPSIGQSIEGRDLFAIHLTSKVGNPAKKPQIYFQGQIHAREWLSGTTVGFIVNQLLSKYGKDAAVTKILDTVELIVVPIVNPDGYSYSWNSNRMWRKNRRQNSPGVYGVDLNRNYNVDWDADSGASRSPHSETYKGTAPNSEPEVAACSKYFLKHTRIIGGIDFHTFSQLILRPYGFLRTPAPHERQLKSVGDAMSSIIKSIHGKNYKSITSYALYPTSGTAGDWFYGEEVLKVFGRRVYGYTFELRPTSMFEGGFVMPASSIIPTGEELFAAIMYFIPAVVEKPL